jgi:hypothetical protein
MKFLILVFSWFILLILFWPLALLALVLVPLIWLVTLPFRLLFLCVEALFVFLRTVLFLPARVLGYRGR